MVSGGLGMKYQEYLWLLRVPSDKQLTILSPDYHTES